MVATRRQAAIPKVEVSTSFKRRLPSRPPKKSTSRLRKKFDEDTDMPEDESDWEEAPKRKVKRVKRSHKTTRKPNTRNLASMLTMPLDIHLEILSWLTSKDLISISRLTKEFRRTLTARSATGIWKVARENDGIPAPPPAMSELRWAVLLFGGTRCENCGTSGVCIIDFGIRRRVCRACKKKNLVVTLKFRKEYTEYDEVLLDMIPYTNIGGWARGRHSVAKFYWLDDTIDMSKQWATLQDAIYRRVPGARQTATEFHEARKDLVQAITTGVRDYEAWDNGLKHAQYTEVNRKRENRRDEIYKRLRELGYLQSDIDRISWSTQIDQSRELTDRIWNRIRPILEANIRDRRQALASWERKLIFQQVFNNYLKTLSPKEWVHHPSINDVLEFPAISAIINAEWDITVPKKHLEALVPQIPESISTWRRNRKEVLQGQVLDFRRRLETQNPRSQRASRRAQASGVDILDLATSIFACKRWFGCGPTYGWGRSYASIWFGWRGVSFHSCWDLWGNIDDSPQSFEIPFEIPEKGYRLAVEFIKMAGLDPETATIGDMDKTGHKYFCTVCDFQKLVHGWRDAVSHGLSRDHIDTPAKWRKLTKAELQRVETLNEPQLQDRVWGCGHCDFNFKNWEMKWEVEYHLSDSHEIQTPVEGEDIIFFPNRRLYQPPNLRCK